MRGNGVYCHIDNDQAPPLNVYGNDGVQHMLELLLDADVTKDIRFTRTTFFQSYQAENGLLFTFLPCQHKADEDSGFYLVEKGGKRLVYAQDTGLFLEETLNFLAGKELDLLSLDCCFGKRSSGGWGHMGMPDNQQVVERLRENGARHRPYPPDRQPFFPQLQASSTTSWWRKPPAHGFEWPTTA